MTQLPISELLDDARRLALSGDTAAARAMYLAALKKEPTNICALRELGTLAFGGGYVAAARTAFEQAALLHPNDAGVQLNLAETLLQDGKTDVALAHFTRALELDHTLYRAHQGLSRIFAAQGNKTASREHRDQGFTGHAFAPQLYRGSGTGLRVLLLTTTDTGNIPLQHLMDEKTFAVTAAYAEYIDDCDPLPEHDLVLNTIGDADICQTALERAEAIVVRSKAPVINNPSLVRRTGRADVARLMRDVPGLRTPKITQTTRSFLSSNAAHLTFPRLLRSPGFHTGQHFDLVEQADQLVSALSMLPTEDVLDIEYLDARGQDGQFRKYRVMMIDGALYPLHLAISQSWKVHYFTADMEENADHRAKEENFLDNMESVLGSRAVAALQEVAKRLGLDYAGIDFGIDKAGSLLLFEANATMIILPPGPDPMWDYRRAPINRAVDATKSLIRRAASGSSTSGTE